MTRSVASARIHRHTHYGSPVIPPRLAATTSGSLALPCTLNYTEAIPTPQPFQSCAVGVLGSAHKKGTRKGCLMRKVRSFGRPTSAYPLRLTQYTSSPYGDYLRVLALPCTLNYTEVIPTLATGSVMRGRGLGSAHKKAPLRVPYVSGSPRTAGILQLSYLDAFIPGPRGR